jgi:transposase
VVVGRWGLQRRGRSEHQLLGELGARNCAGYREEGPAGIGDRRHGNPGAAPLLAATQQEQLRAALGGLAPDGGLWTGRKVAAWIGAAIGRSVDPARGWEWLRRLGFTPQRPRPRETRGDATAQEAFKKGGSPPRWPR